MEQIYFATDECVATHLTEGKIAILSNPLYNRYVLIKLMYLQGKLCLEERKVVESPLFATLYLADDFQLYNELKKRQIRVTIFNHVTLVKSLIFNRSILPVNVRLDLLAYFHPTLKV
jgi:hypothetical protein